MGAEIFKIDPSWAEKLRKTRVPFLMTPTVCPVPSDRSKVWLLGEERSIDPVLTLATLQMLMLGNCQELEAVPAPETTDDPIYDLLPPQEYIIAFVVPALIIVGMLLLAVLIACVLHK